MASPYESERNPFAAPPPPLDDGIAPVGSLGRINERQPSAVASAVCFFKSSTRPLTAFFHIAFKAGSIVLYLFGNFAGLDFITVFVGTVLMLAFDFWTCKNVTGRLLVGLRWWVTVQEDGSNKWTYESAPPGTKIHAVDSRIFWWGLYGTALSWVAFALLSFIRLSFEWLLIDVVALALVWTNLLGYLRCSSDASKRLRATLASGAMRGLSFVPGGLGAGLVTMLGAGAASMMARVTAGAGTSPTATGGGTTPAVAAAAPVTQPVAASGATAPLVSGGAGFSGDVSGTGGAGNFDVGEEDVRI